MNEEIIQKILQASSSKILTGLSIDNGIAVSDAFEKLIRMTLEHIDPTQYPNANKLLLSSGQRMIDDVSKLPPDSRLDYIQKEILSIEINKIDAVSWKLIQQHISQSLDLATLQERAEEIQKKIKRINEEIVKKGSDWQNQLGYLLGEASLECGFILGQSEYCSMRSARLFESTHLKKND